MADTAEQKAAAEAAAKQAAEQKAAADKAAAAEAEARKPQRRTVAHAVFNYTDGGHARMAVRGEELTLSPAEAKRGEALGAFEPSAAELAQAEAERLADEQAIADGAAREAKQARLQAEAIAKQRG